MKKAMTLVLEDADITELTRILMDEDAEAALAFLKQHLKGKLRETLEGGWKVLIQVPGAGAITVQGNLFKSWGGVIVAEDGAYLESIALTRTLPCLAEPGKIIVIGSPSRDLGDVLPFLAALPSIITYNPDACTLTFRRERGFLTLYHDKVIFTQLDDTAQGLELLAALVDAINATWTHRHELTAMSKPRRAPRPLDVWPLLPQSNCKQCGEMTCMAFAFAVLQQQRDVDECKPLAEDAAFADRRVTLEAMLGTGA